MNKIFFNILFLLIGAIAFASPVAARMKEKNSDFKFPPKSETFHYNERMLEASEIATLNAGKYSHRHCWRSVKNALFEANAVPYRPTSKYAWQAGAELEEKFDFKKLEVSDPFDAPIGSLLVYGGPGSGHVEFRTEDGFVSDFFATHPSHRPLLGVYVLASAASKSFPE